MAVQHTFPATVVATNSPNQDSAVSAGTLPSPNVNVDARFISATSDCVPPDEGSPDGPLVVCATPPVSQGNSLIVNIYVTADTPSNVNVVYDNTEAGRLRSKNSQPMATTLVLPLARLWPSTTYTYQVFAENTLRQVSDGTAGSFTIGPLPAGL
jgi:hypothetical protein